MPVLTSTSLPSSSGAAIAEFADWFEGLLASNHIEVAQSSVLRKDIDALKFLGQAFRRTATFPGGTDMSDFFRRTLGLEYVIKAIHMALRTASGQFLLSRLDVFKGADVSLVNRTQQSIKKDLLWEFVVACICSHFCSNVRFEEPDIRFQYSGEDWGIPCKMFYTSSQRGQIESVVTAARQLERSSAFHGCIVVSLVNLIDHSRYLRSRPNQPDAFLSFNDWRVPPKMVQSEMTNLINPLITKSLIKRLTSDSKIGQERWKTRGIIFVAQTVYTSNLTPFFPTVCVFHGFRNIHGIEMNFLQDFNRTAQVVMNEAI